MRINEIEDYDLVVWRTISSSGGSFYDDYKDLKRRYMFLSSHYDDSTQKNIIQDTIKNIGDMKLEISRMYRFCKNSKFDSEIEEFVKSLKLMYNSCREMIKELERFL